MTDMASVRRAEARDVAAIARIHVDGWRSTYSGIVPDDYLAGMSYESREQRWKAALGDPKGETSTFVAEAGSDGVVGFATCGPERTGDPDFRGELRTIYVAGHMQRKGVGLMLTSYVADDLRVRGLGSMLVWALELNPSTRYYEVIGGERVRSKEIVIGGRPLTVVAYGWSSLETLIAGLKSRMEERR
jgi:ribosomal protein S18 acetylase RimI-like enzyme